jgi:ATP-dependent RNA helicase DDX41
LPDSQKSLIEINRELIRERGEKTEEEKRAEQEAYLLEHLAKERQPLLSRKQVAGVAEAFTGVIETGWRPPRAHREKPEEFHDAKRAEWGIQVQGERVPPPLRRFHLMRLPAPVLQALQDKGIAAPTPIQMQGLPVVLSGRDMIGVASTGSGKTLVFTLPLVLLALRKELEQPLGPGEGPFGLVLVPLRELAVQIHSIAENFALYLQKAGMPAVHVMLAIGGIKMGDQWRKIPSHSGPQCVVATLGCLMGLLQSRRLRLDRCEYLAMDEADRLVDVKFEDELRRLFDAFTRRRQTVLFSATMPKRVQELSLTALIDPIVVNVGSANRANMDVIQEVEYVKAETRLLYLLECLQKTPPPVLVFANSHGAVDDVLEYLLVKGVDACAIHGGKLQEERQRAVEQFKTGAKDVLVATDVASKGLDFDKIQHVINYDMPSEIEDYIHRIGRTGRRGRTGVATSFINRDCKPAFLLDLKHLLREAKQAIPPVLAAIEDPTEYSRPGDEDRSCQYCGGMGHSILDCPKREKENRGHRHDHYGFDVAGDEM